MNWLVIPGVIITLLGVAGLGYCIVRAAAIKRAQLDDNQLATELQRLIPWNMASVCLGALGLAMVLVGRLL